MKRTIIILLIAASVGITVFINFTKEPLSPELRSAVEEALLKEPEFPARPVWWEDDRLMAIGVVKKQENHDADAKKACSIARKLGVTELAVEVYDVLSIQSAKEWNLIGRADCRK